MQPILFTLFGYPIQTYGFFMSLGMLSGLAFLLITLLKKQKPIEPYIDLVYLMLFAGILGGRTYFVATHWQEFSGEPLKILLFWQGGISFHGGFMLAFPIYLIYLRAKKFDLWETSDLITPSFALALAWLKIGCLGAGCCHGISCALPWAIVADSMQVKSAFRGMPIHPLQIYESLSLFLLSFIAWKLLTKQKLAHGMIAICFIFFFALLRFCADFLRGDAEYFAFLPGTFTSTQYLALILMISSLLMFIIRNKKKL